MTLSRLDLSELRARAAKFYARLGTHRRLIAGAALLVMVVFAVAAVQATRFALDVFTGLPQREELGRMGRMAQSTTLFDREGQPAFSLGKEERIEVPLSRVSPRVTKALIAVEDQRFFKHQGVDPVRLMAAAWANVRERRAAQGASTLTQQLARQMFLSADKNLRRKMREMVLAFRIEQLFTKQEILQLYLNKVYFGDGLYGIEAASLGYFGRPASELTLGQAALLAGLVKSPSSYAPTVSPERALSRRNLVLQSMLDTRAITKEDYTRAKAEKVELRDVLRRDETWGQHFKEHVRRELVQRFGAERVYEGGLRVYTTIDSNLQQYAERALTESLEELDERRQKQARVRKASTVTVGPHEAPLEAALVALDPETAEVRAMVGGRDSATNGFNRATQARRQPGSAFKPLVFAAALESGFTPATLLDRLDDPVMTPEGEWVPADGHSVASTMTLRTALRTSSNRAAVRLLQEVGIPRAVDYARRVGLGSVPSVPSLALGSGEVNLLSLSAAYAPFATGGLARPPSTIVKVLDRDGTVLYEADTAATRVISETTAFLMANMLADVVNAGTAYRARQMGFTLPAAGKTGTTNDYEDAWFVGFTPKLLTGVWVGFDQPRTIVREGYAGDVAVPLWARFMRAATKGHKAEWYSPPRGMIGARVCRLSGQLANDGCDHAVAINDEGEQELRAYGYTEYFVRGTEPRTYCPIHDERYAFGGVEGELAGGYVPEAVPPAARDEDEKKEDESRAEAGQPKKKGFWSRVFGVFKGGDDDKDKKERKPDPPKRDKPKPGGEGGR